MNNLTKYRITNFEDLEVTVEVNVLHAVDGFEKIKVRWVSQDNDTIIVSVDNVYRIDLEDDGSQKRIWLNSKECAELRPEPVKVDDSATSETIWEKGKGVMPGCIGSSIAEH